MFWTNNHSQISPAVRLFLCSQFLFSWNLGQQLAFVKQMDQAPGTCHCALTHIGGDLGTILRKQMPQSILRSSSGQRAWYRLSIDHVDCCVGGRIRQKLLAMIERMQTSTMPEWRRVNFLIILSKCDLLYPFEQQRC